MYQTNILHGLGLITICGATATGKSGLAITIAQRLNCVILSADSRQVYREFNLGTAKPTADQQQLVPHYLIDICDPTETFTVAEYQELAPQPELRSQLLSLGQKQLYAMLQQVDPVATTKIHQNDPTRIIRALEVFYVTGLPISAQQGENIPNYPILQIGLDCESNALTQRIARRTEQMVADGLVAEVEYLCQKYGTDLPLLNTLGYQEFKQYSAGNISLEEAKKLTVLHTRQFAKRQLTWFRADSQIEWFDADSSDLVERVWQRIQDFLAQLN